MFLGPNVVQNSLGRPKKAPKRLLNGSNTFKKGSKHGPYFYNFVDLFWDHFGGLDLAKKWDQKRPHGVVACSG